MSRQVFISYSSANADAAQRICRALESAGISCWMAPRDVPAGADYPSTIVDAVRSAEVMLVLVTDRSMVSRHVLSEVGHAFNNGKRIVPVRLTAAPLSKDLDYFLSMAQWFDAPDGCTEQNLKRLAAAVEVALRGEPVAQVTDGNAARRRVWRLVAVTVLVLGAGAIVYLRWPRPLKTNPVEHREDAKPAKPSGPTVRVNAADGLEYVWIPPGSFTMGCSPADSQCADDEKPAHPVEIPKGFWLGRTEVTIGAYRKYAARRGLARPRGDDKLPMANVTWAGAKAYCADVGGRLPTEAEWEYAARGGKADAYYGPVASIAWYAENSGGGPHAAGTAAPNAYGLYDMLGNVSEWVLDRYYNRYDVAAPATGAGVEQPLAPNASAVARGGFWDGDARNVRVSHRADFPNDAAEPIVGFRCAMDQ